MHEAMGRTENVHPNLFRCTSAAELIGWASSTVMTHPLAFFLDVQRNPRHSRRLGNGPGVRAKASLFVATDPLASMEEGQEGSGNGRTPEFFRVYISRGVRSAIIRGLFPRYRGVGGPQGSGGRMLGVVANFFEISDFKRVPKAVGTYIHKVKMLHLQPTGSKYD